MADQVMEPPRHCPRTTTPPLRVGVLGCGGIAWRNKLGGGALLDVGVYTLRAAQLFLGADVTAVGSVSRWEPGVDVDLGGSALLCSATGVAAQLTFSFQSSYRSTYSVWGGEGRITLDRALTTPHTLSPTLRLEQSGQHPGDHTPGRRPIRQPHSPSPPSPAPTSSRTGRRCFGSRFCWSGSVSWRDKDGSAPDGRPEPGLGAARTDRDAH